MGIAIPQVITSDRATGAQVIDGSLKFDGASNQVLTRTPGSSGNRKTWTVSFWAKLNDIVGYQYFFSAGGTDVSSLTGSNFLLFQQDNSASTFYIQDYSGSANWIINPDDVFRDSTSFYHFLLKLDTPNDSVQLYVNNRLVISGSTTNPSTNYDGFWNHTVNHRISDGTYGLGAQLTQFYNIDGQALDPSYFGFTDPLTNTWRPKKYSGTFARSSPNNGTTWSNNTTSGSVYSGYSWTGAFNGTITGSPSPSNTVIQASGGFAQIQFSQFSSIESVKVVYYGGTGGQIYINYGESSQQLHAATTAGDLGNGVQPSHTFTTSELTNLRITNTGSADFPYLYAIYVDGTLLIDGLNDTGVNSFYLPFDGNSPIGQDQSGQGNDWTPVNFGGSVELDNPQVSGAKPILNTTQGGTQAGVGVFGSEVGAYYAVTVPSGIGGGYYLDGTQKPTLSLIRGATYTFDQSDSSNSGHPLVFGTTADGNDYSDGVTTNGTPGSAGAYTKITVPHNAPDTLYYHCSVHGGMGSSTSQTTDTKKADPYAWKNVLGLPLVGSANDVSNQINSGSTTKVVTVDGAVASSAFSNFYTGSFEFDGTDDDLTIPDSADFNFGTGDFTMEMWVYSDASQTKEIMGQRGAGVEGAFSIYHVGANILLYVGSNGSSWDIVAGDTIATNVVGQWTHIAIVRNGNNFLTFQNGVHVSTTVDSGTVQDSSSPLSIGSNAGTFFFDGKLSDIRIYKGVAKYTSDFVVPSTSPDILPDTPSGVSGGSKLTKITDGAVSFDGNGDYLSLAHNSDFDMYNSIYTWDLFFYTTDLSSGTDDEGYGTLFSQCTAGSNVTYGLGFDGSGNLSFKYWNGSGSVSTTATTKIGTNRWYHVAIVKDTASATSGNTKIFLDGKLEATTAVSGTFSNSTDPLEIGADRRSGGGSYDYFQGQISNLRAVKGTALYTSDFTPPTAPLTDVTNTKLLCCQSNTLAGSAAVTPVTGNTGYTGTSQSIILNQANLNAGTVANVVDGSTSTSADIRNAGSFVQLVFPQQQNGTLQVNVANGNDVGDDNIRVFIDGVEGTSFDVSSQQWYTIHTGDFTTVKLEHQGSTTGNIFGFRIGTGGDTIISRSVAPVGNAAATNFNPFTTDINTVRGQETGYATLNPLDTVNSPVLSNGNLDQTETTAEYGRARSTLSFDVEDSNGYYAEITATGSAASATAFGIIPTDQKLDTGATNGITGYKGLSGRSGPAWWTVDGAVNGTTDTGLSANPGDVLALAVKNGSVDMYINGLFVGTFSGLSGQYSFITSAYGTTNALSANFGQKPFKFPPPEGFQPLNTANVRPEIVIARPDQYVGVTTYVGNESSRVINCGFKPDFVWIKEKSGIYHHAIYDSVRGPLKSLSSSRVDIAEQTETEGLNSFVTNGFSFAGGGPGFYYVNRTGGDYVAWTWKAGGNKNTFNVDDVGYASAADAGLNGGSGITLTGASVGTKQGFSILRYTGGESGSTLSHGLTQAPDFWIIKNLSGDTQGTAGPHWYTKHKSLPGGKTGNDSLFLNLTNAQGSNGPHGICKTSGDSLFEFVDGSSNDVNWHTHDSAATYICYAWHDVPGLQKFGKYTGNASTDGPYVELGFRPAVVIYKRTDNSSSAHWVITDSERDPFNLAGKTLGANLTDVEATSNSIDFLSNGFKIRASGTVHNASGGTYIYMAWAEAPTVDLFGGGANAR